MGSEVIISDTVWEDLRKTKSNEIRNQILMKYIHLIKYLVNRIAPSYKNYVDYDDLYSYGVLGMFDAIDKYDISKGVKFETYASLRIRGMIIDQIRKQDWVPRNVRNTAKTIEEAYAFLETKHGRIPEDNEVAEYLNITVDEFKKKLDDSCTYNIISLEEQIIEIFDKNSIDNNIKTPENILEDKELKKELIKCINKLNDREKIIISLYYVEELTLKEIGEIMGVSESRMSQLHSRILIKLKAELSK